MGKLAVDFSSLWIRQRLDSNLVHFVTGAGDELDSVVALCDELVTDRDASFGVDARRRLYENWLSSGNRCVMTLQTTNEGLVGATMVLPMKPASFERYRFGKLDAIRIERDDLCSPAHVDARTFLLVDILVLRMEPILTLIRRDNLPLQELRITAVARHVAEYYDGTTLPRPMIVAATNHSKVVPRLRALEWIEIGAEESGLPVFSVNLGNLDGMSERVRQFYQLILEQILTAISLGHNQPA